MIDTSSAIMYSTGTPLCLCGVQVVMSKSQLAEYGLLGSWSKAKAERGNDKISVIDLDEHGRRAGLLEMALSLNTRIEGVPKGSTC